MKPFQFKFNSISQSLYLGGIRSTTIRLIVLLSIVLPFTISAQSYNLTGVWQSDAGGCYQIRQNGNEVLWAGGPIGSVSAHNVFHGAIAGNTLTGLWYDLPANPYQAFGASLSVRVESNNRMVKVSESAPYRASTWTKTNGTCNTNNSGGQDNSGIWRLTTVLPSGDPFAGTYWVDVNLTIRNGQISGTGTWSNGVNSKFTGSVNGSGVSFQREDNSGFRASFFGKVSDEGKMEGSGKNDPSSPGGNNSTYTWTLVRQ